MRTLTIPWGTIHCHRDLNNAEFVPRTGWIKIGQLTKIRVIWEMASAMSKARLEFAFHGSEDNVLVCAAAGGTVELIMC